MKTVSSQLVGFLAERGARDCSVAWCQAQR